ncbi:PASTA domain-containing protein [Microbispora rosea]|nr:PASTA domain-containing protein [Microbispora rosea]
MVVVPLLGGMAKQAAISKLSSLGVTPTLVEENSDTISAGIVIGTDLASGQFIRSGESVTLRVSLGPNLSPSPRQISPRAKDTPGPTTGVPNMVGFTLRDAKDTLQGAGFKVKTVEQPSDAVPQGAVIDQVPQSRAELTPGPTITLIVSTGPLGNVPPGGDDIF